MNEVKNEFFIIKDVEKFFPGLKAYAVRQLILKGVIRFNKCGSKYILNTVWLSEDLEKLATKNMKPSENENNQYGRLRKIN
jgi:hypothetical protein